MLKPFFIFPGSDISCIPSGSFEKDVYTSFNTSAYMDEDQFQQWLSYFIKDIADRRTRYGVVNTILLIIDGHSSRLNPSTVLTAACNDIVLFCLPSHMTHLLQPNDCAFNKVVKDNLQRHITTMLEAREDISCGELAAMTCKSISEENIPRSIIHSFRHTGICPIDPLRMSSLLQNENVQPFKSADEKLTHVVVELTKEHLAKMEHLCQQKRKREEATPVVRKNRFSTKKARVLTSVENQAALRYSKELCGLESMLVDDMRKQMTEKLGFSLASLHKADDLNGKWKTKKEMVAMIHQHYDNNWENTISQIESEINRNIVVSRPTAAMNGAKED